MRNQKKRKKKKSDHMKERIFIQRAKEHTDMEEFIRKQFSQARCGNIEVQHTPIMTRIIIHTITPGLVIGSGGERIKETLEELKKRFDIENPQIDVQRIENPDLEPYIIAQSIAGSIERGINFKRLGNFYTSKIMKAGAVGCEIVLSGKFTGQRGRKERFTSGYLKKCGEPAERDVIKGFAVASPKLGNTGVTVKIMIRKPGVILKEALSVPEETVCEDNTKKEEKEEEVKEEKKNEQAEKEKKEKKTKKRTKKKAEAAAKAEDKKEEKKEETVK
jgi:small subunit ribosomal protein S3